MSEVATQSAGKGVQPSHQQQRGGTGHKQRETCGQIQNTRSNQKLQNYMIYIYSTLRELYHWLVCLLSFQVFTALNVQTAVV